MEKSPLSTPKKKLLLVWGYQRKDWREAFERIRDDFEYVYLFWVFPEQDSTPIEDQVAYWSDYPSAQAVLRDIKPDKVIFMGLDTPNSIALRSACKAKKIPAYTFQHGITNNLDNYIFFLKIAKQTKKEAIQQQTKEKLPKGNLYRFLLSFVLRSVRLGNLAAIRDIFLFQYYKRRHKMVDFMALQKVNGKSRMPDHHIDYTRYNAQLYVDRDDLDPSKIIEVGMPQMDLYFEKANIHTTNTEEPYLLLIDQALAENKTFNSAGYGITKEYFNEFYLKLNTYAESVNCRLYIKLHPNSYDDTFRVSHPNITYIKDADNPKLLLESTAVFGMFSTMLVPAIYFKPCCIFKIWERGRLENCVEELGIAQILNFHTFAADEIDMLNFEKSADGMKEFVSRYFHQADGHSAERLRTVLLA